jgi:hypothetical protein
MAIVSDSAKEAGSLTLVMLVQELLALWILTLGMLVIGVLLLGLRLLGYGLVWRGMLPIHGIRRSIHRVAMLRVSATLSVPR